MVLGKPIPVIAPQLATLYKAKGVGNGLGRCAALDNRRLIHDAQPCDTGWSSFVHDCLGRKSRALALPAVPYLCAQC